MGRPYETEMLQLSSTFKWASSVCIKKMQKFIENTNNLKLLAIGSGGSLTTANFLAYIHQKYTGQLSTPSTTLRTMELSHSTDIAAWFLSASGKNIDIKMAFNHLLSQEVKQIGVFCCKENSPISKIVYDHPYTNLFEYELPSGKDGFLATNSLFCSVAIIARAYVTAFHDEKHWQEIQANIDEFLLNTQMWEQLEKEANALWDKAVTITIHDTPTMSGAFDLESKFTEAALGVVQPADYRNFAHGRHHWLAKRAHQTGLLAFYSRESQDLAEKTLKLIPSSLPLMRIFFDMPSLAATIASIVVAFRLTQWAGISQGIDPGRPGVPEFGKRLYHLTFPKKKRTRYAEMGEVQKAAIERKSGASIEKLKKSGKLKFWHEQYLSFVDKLKNTAISSVVLDYDGTVVDSRDRFSPPISSISKEFDRLLSNTDITVGFSTGRGKSIKNDLRSVVDEKFWKRILIGYYNGAEVASLDDNDAPSPFNVNIVDSELLILKEKIEENIKEWCEVPSLELRNFQLGISCKSICDLSLLWKLCTELSLRNKLSVKIFCSGHSVDILSKGTSKLSVIDRIQGENSGNNVLAIGDQGAWPGNDHELLSNTLALSVETVNSDPTTCWNLARPGQVGINVTKLYLSSLAEKKGKVFFDAESLL